MISPGEYEQAEKEQAWTWRWNQQKLEDSGKKAWRNAENPGRFLGVDYSFQPWFFPKTGRFCSSGFLEVFWKEGALKRMGKVPI